MNTRMYFGDGVYGEFDGHHIILMANGVGSEATDRVYLEPGIFPALKEWVHGGYPDYNTGKKFNEA